MHLRERRTIRPPRRYDEEDFFTPSRSGSIPQPQPQSQSMLKPRPRTLMMPPSVRPSFPPPYVDYNPNHPPAAFPTLDNPVPESLRREREKDEEMKNRTKYRGRGVRMAKIRSGRFGTAGSNTLQLQGGINKRFNGCEIADVDMNDDNDDGNTTELAEDDVPDMCDMETSDEDEESILEDEDEDDTSGREYGINPAHFQNVQWRDLSPILQTEIIENLSLVYQWPHIAILLHLSSEDQKAAAEHAAARREQAANENEHLKEMQEKQLKALLRIDNSALKKSRVPAQLVFRKISKQHLRDAKVHPDPDYLMSTAKEVIAAKCYLRRVGLDPGFAGEWKCDLAAIQQPSGINPSGVEELIWTLDSNHPDGIEQDTGAAIGRQNTPPPSLSRRIKTPKPKKTGITPRVTPKVRFINTLGVHGAIVPQNSTQERNSGSRKESKPYHVSTSGLKTAQNILEKNQDTLNRTPDRTRSCATPGTNKSEDTVVCLRIGPEGAARVDNLFGMSSPGLLPFPSSPPLPSGGLVSMSLQRPPPALQLEPASEDMMVTTLSPTGPLTPTLESNPAERHKRKYEKPLERVLSGVWWYDRDTPKLTDQTAGHSSSLKLQERLLAARAENEIRQLARSSDQSRTATKPGTMQLPIRNSPLKHMTNCSCESSERPVTPQISGSDSPSAIVSSPIRRSNLGQNTPQIRLTLPTCSKVDNDQAEEEEYSPPYSPITPPNSAAETSSSHGAQEAQTGNSGHMETKELAEAIFKAAVAASRMEETDDEVDDNVAVSSHVQASTQSSGTQETSHESEAIARPSPLQVSQSSFTETTPSSEPSTQIAAQSTFCNSMEKKVQENSHAADNAQENVPLPEVQPSIKARKRSTKTCAESQRRKSARLNPPEARSLRPKTNVKYKF
ncbi:hypothetical protein PRK78_002108 [Emydomyces testavorans]|uniref:Uncharacterized protein n=1 Tax=Emydomyces testavorans TaxID=2070801 RepID=A0AAF0DF32_9EURO|nr:hypothetical protein PRK78_002108 [Emydomyces testavorans]